MKKLIILSIWFPSVIMTFFSSILFYFSYTKHLMAREKYKQFIEKPKLYQTYSSLPKKIDTYSITIKKEDAIPILISQYLEKYNSPMASSAAEFHNIFRNSRVDPLIPLAIAQCESNLGKKMPPDCHNPFGLGIHSEGTLCFENWAEGYERMAKELKKEKFIGDVFFKSPDEIMKRYCPNSIEKGGSWAKCVNKFVKEIENFKFIKK